MSRDLSLRHSSIVSSDVVDGELIDQVQEHSLCGQFHPVFGTEVECCCGDTHSVSPYVCCGCGHHHDMDATCLPQGQCGSFICCIP